jgi:hypothetical protein
VSEYAFSASFEYVIYCSRASKLAITILFSTLSHPNRKANREIASYGMILDALGLI